MSYALYGGIAVVVGIGVYKYFNSSAIDADNNDDESESENSTQQQTTKQQPKFRSLNPKVFQPLELPLHKQETHKKVSDIWHKPLEETAVFIDLPRLAKRMDISVDGKSVLEPQDNQETMQAVANVVECVARFAESEQHFQLIQKELRNLAVRSEHSAASIWIKELFIDTIGIDSFTTTIFRCIHQGLVMPLSFAIRAHTRLLVKDVKTRDGWRVQLTLDTQQRSAAVTHVRREQSFGNDGADAREQFVIELQTRLVVDAARTLRDVDTRIVHAAPLSADLAPVFQREIDNITRWNDAV